MYVCVCVYAWKVLCGVPALRTSFSHKSYILLESFLGSAGIHCIVKSVQFCQDARISGCILILL